MKNTGRPTNPLPGLVADSVRPNRLPDVEWLQSYLSSGSPVGGPLMLSLGETWSGTPAPLMSALGQVPPSTHGYQISMYGLPLLRNVLKEYVADTQRLPHSDSWELAVSWTGTRSAMRDFALLVAADRRRSHRQPGTILAVAPSWDYAGVTEPLGFTTTYVPFDPVALQGPQPSDIRTAVSRLAYDELALVVVNPQHNPTGANWSPDLVKALFEVAREHKAALLIDDAYYGLCPPEEPVTSALEILLSDAGGPPAGTRWLAVRSLGKQFRCNGWALGALISEPDTLDTLVNDYRPQHTFNYAVHLQWAMAQWLTDRPAVEAYLDQERLAISRKREAVLARLPAEVRSRTLAGPAAPYILYPCPDDMPLIDYLRKAAREYGVLLSDAWPLARVGATAHTGYVRLYLGPDDEVLQEAVDRLEEAGMWPPGLISSSAQSAESAPPELPLW